MTLAMAIGANELWTLVLAVCCCIACGTVGCYLVLRRMSMLGDAISHAVLPGLALAFLLTASRDVVPMLLGAAAAGLLTALLSAGLTRIGRIAEDASLGVVFSLLFAAGVVLLAFLPSDIDLDPSCVLYGSIETAPLKSMTFLGIQMPDVLPRMLLAAVVNVIVIGVFFKEIRIVAFDPALATTLGLSAAAVHYGLMGLVAATTVVSFEAVGSVLVVAMLIAPGATAHLLTDRLGSMFVLAAVAGTTAAISGYAVAIWFDVSVAGMISVAAGVQFVGVAIGAPRHGVLSRAARQASLALRITGEDALGMLYRWHEHAGDQERMRAGEVSTGLGGGLLPRVAILMLRRRGLVSAAAAGGLTLTPEGLEAARSVVRSHRLWETYLARRLGLPVDHLHEPSHRAEHFITTALERELASEVGAEVDPHGKPIPRSAD